MVDYYGEMRDEPRRAVEQNVKARAPQGHLQSRIDQELSLRLEARDGGPHDLPEIERELTMIEGAFHGVEQRMGELIAKLRAVVDPKAFAAVMEHQRTSLNDPGLAEDAVPRTDLGRRLREVQHRVTEVEHVLSYVGQGVAL